MTVSGVPDEIRERVAKAIVDAACSCHEGYSDRGLVAPTCYAHESDVIDAVLAVLDRDALIAMLGAEQVGWRRREASSAFRRLGPIKAFDDDEPVYRFPAQEDR